MLDGLYKDDWLCRVATAGNEREKARAPHTRLGIPHCSVEPGATGVEVVGATSTKVNRLWRLQHACNSRALAEEHAHSGVRRWAISEAIEDAEEVGKGHTERETERGRNLKEEGRRKRGKDEYCGSLGEGEREDGQ